MAYKNIYLTTDLLRPQNIQTLVLNTAFSAYDRYIVMYLLSSSVTFSTWNFRTFQVSGRKTVGHTHTETVKTF